MKALYKHTEEIHNMTAPREVVPVIMNLVKPASVLDVGCGTGTWLKAFEEGGVMDYVGVDGDYVDRLQLCIPLDKFLPKDLRTPWALNRKFDLVLSLEVAEHLPEANAEQFVETLVSHANDTIIFSAAIPGQGGQNHLNEQWGSYWEALFRKQGYHRVDAIRPKVWNNEKVDVWYRQNMFLFVREGNLIHHNNAVQVAEIHPVLWKHKTDILISLFEKTEGFEKGHAGIERSFNALLNAIRNKLGKGGK